MRRNLKALGLCLGLVWIVSCGTKIVRTETEMYHLFEKDFKEFHLPDVVKAKPNWGTKTLPYVTFDEVWDSVLILSTQDGFIIGSSKETGVVVGVHYVPFIIFVEKGEPVKVYIDVMEDLYRRLDDPKKIAVLFKPSILHLAFGDFLEKLATQVYSDLKWKYLYEDKGL